ncbi:MAG: DUF3667 domain-containing protein [Sediminibacterium sp.]
MSHLPERKEKDCLNCGAVVHGRFCHVCGQENIPAKESFWHLVTHFMYDITHFDGKFFSTLKYLLFKPGFLSHEYLRGRRASYLHPIRMYVFTSAFFFLVFFSLNKQDEVIKVNDTKPKSVTAARQMKRLEREKTDYLKDLADSTNSPSEKLELLKQLEITDSDIVRLKRDTTFKNQLKTFSQGSSFNLLAGGKGDSIYKNVNSYDSLQATLPPAKRDGYIHSKFRRQNIHLREKYKNDDKQIWTAVFDKFKHLFPQMFFVSLPLFALMLRLLYVRRKKFFYVNHVVFSIHLYCGTFIIILIGLLVAYLFQLIKVNSDWPGLLFTLAGFFYWYKSMRNFYEQRRGKTILKYLLVLFLSIFIWTILFSIFFIFSAMAI